MCCWFCLPPSLPWRRACGRCARLPIDAIPDLSDVQVIVLTEYPGQAPQVVEDQVTYPLTSAMLTVPQSRVVRGFSFFGISFVYIIFEDGVDPYWARSRVLEYLNAAAARLPDGVTPALGPDATGVGWVYQYALKGENLSLAELRSLQDWVMRFAISRADGVSEVASVGGFVKQYSITVDPVRMRALGITLSEIGEAVAASNMDTGGRTVRVRSSSSWCGGAAIWTASVILRWSRSAPKAASRSFCAMLRGSRSCPTSAGALLS